MSGPARTGINRRLFLRGLAGVAVSLPLLQACAPPAPPAGTSPPPAATTAPAAAKPTEAPKPAAAAPTSAPAAKPGVPRGGEVRFALNNEPPDFDPHATAQASAHTILMNVLDTLVLQNPADNAFVPNLAEKWESAPDGLAWTFMLRKGVKFHDGTPFNAAAVKANFDRVVDPATKSANAINLLGAYDGTDVVDDSTARVKFKKPNPALLDSLSQTFLGMLSPAAIQKFGPDIVRNPVGTGFMKFKEYVPKERITLERNDDYNWAPAIWGHQGPAHLDRITFVFVPEPAARVIALEGGDVNAIENVAEQDVARLKADPRYTLIQAPIPGGTHMLFMNVEKPPFDNLNVRKAVLHGMNHDEVVQTGLFGLYKPAQGPFSENLRFYSKKVEGMYPYDPTKAGQLLDEAGWRLGSDGIRAKDGQPLKLISLTFPGFQPLIVATQALLRKIGMDVDVRVFDQNTRVQMTHRGEHHFGSTGFVTSDPLGVSLLFHSRNIGGFAWSRYKSDAFDKLWDDAAVETNTEKRAALYESIQLEIMQQALVYPMAQLTRLNFTSSKVKGMRQDARGVYPWMYDTYIEP
jgi:peptide/nickel transport system substrate-binding protein